MDQNLSGNDDVGVQNYTRDPAALVRAENVNVIHDRTTRVLLWVEQESDSQSDPFRGIPETYQSRDPGARLPAPTD